MTVIDHRLAHRPSMEIRKDRLRRWVCSCGRVWPLRAVDDEQAIQDAAETVTHYLRPPE